MNSKYIILPILVLVVFLLYSCAPGGPFFGKAVEPGTCPEISSCSELAEFSDVDEAECIQILRQDGCEVDYERITEDCACSGFDFSCECSDSCEGSLDPEEKGCGLSEEECADAEDEAEEWCSQMEEHEQEAAEAEESFVSCFEEIEQLDVASCFDEAEELNDERISCEEDSAVVEEELGECADAQEESCPTYDEMTEEWNEVQDALEAEYDLSVGDQSYTTKCEEVDNHINEMEDLKEDPLGEGYSCDDFPEREWAAGIPGVYQDICAQIDGAISQLEDISDACEELQNRKDELDTEISDLAEVCFAASDCRVEKTEELEAKAGECELVTDSFEEKSSECEELQDQAEELENECEEKQATYEEIKNTLETARENCEELGRTAELCDEACEEPADEVEVEYSCSCAVDPEECDVDVSSCVEEGDVFFDCEIDSSSCDEADLSDCSCSYQCEPDVPGCGDSLFDDLGCEETADLENCACEDAVVDCECETTEETVTILPEQIHERETAPTETYEFQADTRGIRPATCGVTTVVYQAKIKRGRYETDQGSFISCRNPNGCVVCNNPAGCSAGYVIRSEVDPGEQYDFINADLNKDVLIFGIDPAAATFTLKEIARDGRHLFTPAETNYYPCGEVCDDGIDNLPPRVGWSADLDCGDFNCRGKVGMTSEDDWNYADVKGECDQPQGCLCEPSVEATCDDGFSNDRDNLPDCADSDCVGKTVGPSEQACEIPERTCTDFFDNDNDGLRDCADPDCDGQTGGRLGQLCERPEAGLKTPGICHDNFDNDGDRDKDCQDVADCGSQCCYRKSLPQGTLIRWGEYGPGMYAFPNEQFTPIACSDARGCVVCSQPLGCGEGSEIRIESQRLVISSINPTGKSFVLTRVGEGRGYQFVNAEFIHETNYQPWDISCFAYELDLGSVVVTDIIFPDEFEYGLVLVNQTSKETWHTVAIREKFTKPIVYMGPLSFNGADPAHVRIRNVNQTSFQFKIEEWNYLDGKHGRETVSYLIVEEGRASYDNILVQAGKVQAGTTFTQVTFPKRFRSVPVVLAMTQTFNGPDAIITQVSDVTAAGFRVKIQEEEGGDQRHTPETVAYLAINPTSQSHARANMLSGYTQDWKNLVSATPGIPVLLAGVTSNNGADPVEIRYSLLPKDVQIKLEEERSKDNEVSHQEENVAYIALWKEVCDGLDNDGDNQIDAPVIPPLCPPDLRCSSLEKACVEADCFDSLDNDGDSFIDCRDANCAADCYIPPELYVPSEICTNGMDDDTDGKIDCADGDCASATACQPTAPKEACDNKKDDDLDGKIDCLDIDCAKNPVCQKEICTNKIDDDNDKRIDCADVECLNSPACVSAIK